VRFLVIAIAVAFVIGMAVLTALDFKNNGVTGLGIVGLIVVIVLGVGIIGAFTEPPKKKK
jgi:lipopolysaccharide export LptBFGC system permease protein LptF